MYPAGTSGNTLSLTGGVPAVATVVAVPCVTMAIPLPPLLRAMRPRHWLKNGFVLAPALFAGHAFDAPVLLRAGLAAVAFCLVSSAGYLVNDVLDREADRADPVKRLRP